MTDPNLAEMLRDALEHVHDTAYLSLHLLAEVIAPCMPGIDVDPAQRGINVHSCLLSWIEQMKPASGSDEHSPEYRRYLILHKRYVLNQRMWQIETQLSISERQARRDHAQALEALTALVHSHVERQSLRMPSEVADAQTASIQDAVHRLMPVLSGIPLVPLFANVVGMWQHVRRHGSCELCFDVQPPDLNVFTDRGILTELLMKLLLGAVDDPGCDHMLSLRAEKLGQGIAIVIQSAQGIWSEGNENWQIAQMLARTLGMSLKKTVNASTQFFTNVTLMLPAGEKVRRVLVIDDEAVTIELVRDYLSAQPYEIAGETSPEAGLRKADEWQPDVIVLDVMMPGMAGWELLQRIRHTPQLANVPVIVNSVFNDQALALDLGATRFFRKPILRHQLIEVLEELLRTGSDGWQHAEQRA